MSQNKQLVLYARLIFVALFVASVVVFGSLKLKGNQLEQLMITTANGNQLTLIVEVARTDEQKRVGLMDRSYLGENKGMLFLYDVPRTVNMWMKNTRIPLDMIFIGEDGVIVKISENTEPYSLKIISSDVPVSAVLEVNAGLSSLYGMSKGDMVEFHFLTNK